MAGFTRSERKALFVVSVLIFVSLIIQWIGPQRSNTKIYDYSLQDSLFKVLSADTLPLSPAESGAVKVPVPKPAAVKKKTLMPASIDVNTASRQELVRLPGIGPVTARSIIEYRERNGRFKEIDDLQNVKRIGPKTLEKIKPFVKLGPNGKQ